MTKALVAAIILILCCMPRVLQTVKRLAQASVLVICCLLGIAVLPLLAALIALGKAIADEVGKVLITIFFFPAIGFRAFLNRRSATFWARQGDE